MREGLGTTRREALQGATGLALAFTAGPLLAACGSSSDNGASEGNALERLQSSGTVSIGFSNEAPYSFEDGGDLTGADSDVVRAVLQELGVEDLETTLVEFDSLIPALTANRFDMSVSGQFITPERCAEIAFSRPHYCINDALAVPAGNPDDLSDYKSVAADPNLQIGLLSGATEVDRAKAAGVTEDQIQFFKDQLDGLDALKSGRVDAYGNSSISLNYGVKTTQEGAVEVLPSFESIVDGEVFKGCAGVGFKKEDIELRDAFDEKLEELGPDRIAELVEPYGITAADVQRAFKLTREDLGCE